MGLVSRGLRRARFCLLGLNEVRLEDRFIGENGCTTWNRRIRFKTTSSLAILSFDLMKPDNFSVYRKGKVECFVR